MMGMGQKCGPALAAGNTVVAKPPELAPFGMLRFAELALEAGLPPGVLRSDDGQGAEMRSRTRRRQHGGGEAPRTCTVWHVAFRRTGSRSGIAPRCPPI